MGDLRAKLIRLAAANPELRKHLVPILRGTVKKMGATPIVPDVKTAVARLVKLNDKRKAKALKVQFQQTKFTPSGAVGVTEPAPRPVPKSNEFDEFDVGDNFLYGEDYVAPYSVYASGDHGTGRLPKRVSDEGPYKVAIRVDSTGTDWGLQHKCNCAGWWTLNRKKGQFSNGPFDACKHVIALALKWHKKL
jgi:hypothetical protein